MKRRMLSLVVGVIGCPILGGTATLRDAEDALIRWEAFDKRVTYEDVRSYADAVKQMAVKGEPDVVQRLLGIVRDRSHTLTSRDHALLLACELADETGAELLLDVMESYLAELHAILAKSALTEDDQAVYGSHAMLLESFVVDGVERLMETMPAQERLLGFLTLFHGSGHRPGKAGTECARLIGECRAPLKARQTAVVKIITEHRQAFLREVLLDILDASVFPELRGLVRAKEDPDDFNFAAADALSYLGDTEIMADLKAVRPAFRDKSANTEARLERYIWRIDVQHPPRKLLDYIAATDDSGRGRENRMWAIRRAHKLGLDSARIRDAILQHAANVGTSKQRVFLPPIKQIGLELGILKDTDLADVEISARKVTP